MEKIAMLSVDIEATSEQRDRFYKSLQESQWIKLKNVTTVWKATFKDGVTVQGAISAAKADVQAAATNAQVSKWEAVVHIGDTQPEQF